MKSWKIIVFLVVFIGAIGGILYWASLRPENKLTQILNGGKLGGERMPAADPVVGEVKNPTFSIQKGQATNNTTVYTVRGTISKKPETVEGLYFAEFTIDGDKTKTPIKLILAKAESQLNFGELDKEKKISWNNKTISTIVPLLSVGKPVELRVVIDLTQDKKLRETLQPNVEALLKATEITPTTYSIQPQMIAVL